jgi:hypothetical protein
VTRRLQWWGRIRMILVMKAGMAVMVKSFTATTVTVMKGGQCRTTVTDDEDDEDNEDNEYNDDADIGDDNDNRKVNVMEMRMTRMTRTAMLTEIQSMGMTTRMMTRSRRRTKEHMLVTVKGVSLW